MAVRSVVFIKAACQSQIKQSQLTDTLYTCSEGCRQQFPKPPTFMLSCHKNA